MKRPILASLAAAIFSLGLVGSFLPRAATSHSSTVALFGHHGDHDGDDDGDHDGDDDHGHGRSRCSGVISICLG